MEGCGRTYHGDWVCGRMARRGGRRTFCPACEPVFCSCRQSDYDVNEQCRRCGLCDRRAPRAAATFALVEAGLPIFPV